MIRKFILIAGVFCAFTVASRAQTDTTILEASATATKQIVSPTSIINIFGYVDGYYATDNDHNRIQGSWGLHPDRKFTRANNLKDRFGINLAQLTAFTETDMYHGRVTFQFGDIVDAAFKYNSHPYIQEAFVGVQPIDRLWIDGGYFLTHLGSESIVPKDNFLSNHSMVTYFEPYSHSGIRISYQATQTIKVGLSLLNSAQFVDDRKDLADVGTGLFEDNNENKTLGWYIGYMAPENVFGISYAGVMGNEESGKPKTHHMHTINISTEALKTVILKAQFDFGFKPETKPVGNGANQQFDDGTFIGGAALAHFIFNDMWGATVRFAYFDDQDMVYNTGQKGIQLTGGVEYKPMPTSYVRLEGTYLTLDEGDTGQGKIFTDSDGNTSTNRVEFSLNYGIFFDLLSSR
ncbi:MAG: outer membrane beta-barrel protein [Chloroflexota bacterium]